MALRIFRWAGVLCVLGGLAHALDSELEANSTYDAPFVHFLPPIFRVVLMTALCILGFGVDLHILQRWGMNLWTSRGSVYLPVSSDLGPPSRSAEDSGAGPLFLLALCHVVWATFCWLMYRWHLDPTTGARTMASQTWEVTTIVGLLAMWLVPGPFRPLLRAWNRTLFRLLTPSLRQTIQFSDVIAADMLTSFAKVMGDVWLSIVVVVYFIRGQAVDDQVLVQAEMQWAVPLLISIPYVIRLRQCLSEYGSSNRAIGRPKRPLYNALKYASALPVIWLRVWQPSTTTWFSSYIGVDALWYMSVLVNTLFSFWWDVTNDWGLDLLQYPSIQTIWAQPQAHLPPLHRRTTSDTEASSALEMTEPRPTHARRNSMLRAPEKHLPLPGSVYWVFLVVNLFLRFTWSLKLSSHWQYLVEWQRGLLLLEALEIVRRTVWVLLRVEWELVKHSPAELLS